METSRATVPQANAPVLLLMHCGDDAAGLL
jgi:hypothetical protein